MRGNIYSEQKCPECGGTFKYIERKGALICPNHPDRRAEKGFIVVFGRKIRKRFNNIYEAERFLICLRYEVDQGKFDYREHLTSSPLSFNKLSKQFLEKKKTKLSPGTYRHYCHYIKVSQNYFKNTSVKQIQYAQLENFIDTLEVSGKTKKLYLDCLSSFFHWIKKRREIEVLPEFPVISYELKWRKTITKEDQILILEELKKITVDVSPRIWLAVKFLITYISLRPGELRNLKEGDIDLKKGLLYIPHPKEKRPKFIPLLKDDIDLLREYVPGMPDLYFFRYTKTTSKFKAGDRFGQKLIYKWWKRSCNNLGIKGVDLYGGTRHSSAVDLRKVATPEQIKRATMHATNKAFERYFQVSPDELRDIYKSSSIGKETENMRQDRVAR